MWNSGRIFSYTKNVESDHFVQEIAATDNLFREAIIRLEYKELNIFKYLHSSPGSGVAYNYFPFADLNSDHLGDH